MKLFCKIQCPHYHCQTRQGYALACKFANIAWCNTCGWLELPFIPLQAQVLFCGKNPLLVKEEQTGACCQCAGSRGHWHGFAIMVLADVQKVVFQKPICTAHALPSFLANLDYWTINQVKSSFGGLALQATLCPIHTWTVGSVLWSHPKFRPPTSRSDKPSGIATVTILLVLRCSVVNVFSRGG